MTGPYQPFSRSDPPSIQRSAAQAMGVNGAPRRILPTPVARAATALQSPPARRAYGLMENGEYRDMLPPPTRSGTALSFTPASLFKIVNAVARGISGAAAHAYTGEDPEQAGLRYGILGFRLDTGDMGEALKRAQARDPETFAALFAPHATALLETATAPDPAARKQPVGGKALWLPEWKQKFINASAHDFVQAAQNEWAIEGLARPVVSLLLDEAGVDGGIYFGLALDVAAECGTQAGLEKIRTSASPAPITPAAFAEALSMQAPDTRHRLRALLQDPALQAWTPELNGGLG